ncbi:MAG: ATP-binding protein, partial [Desulfobacteraceae bacterium]
PDKSGPVWVLVNAEPLTDQNGRILQVVITFMDITERKKKEEELTRYHNHLEELVNERTAELADAKEAAEASNKELEAFTYSVSHDLRAPLRHIDGFLKLLQEKAAAALDKQSRHYMANISDAAQKMGLLIDELLAFTRMGRHNLSYQRVKLGVLVQDVIRELESDAADRNVDWHIGDLPAVDCDTAMLRVVLTHLVSNALKFTRPRQQARIEIGSLPGQTTEVVIYVRDNGVGFDMAYGDKLFGVFQRLHHADAFEGTGIGLASVRRIIALHGGRVWAEGKPDQGATFYFALQQT